MKLLGMTLLFYLIDILVFGSFSGLIFVIGYGLNNLMDETNYDLVHMYFVGVVFYVVVDSILSKVKRHYIDAIEFLNTKKNR